MENLGKANARIVIKSSLPKISKNRLKFNFDITAHDWQNLQKSPLMPPVLVEAAVETDGSFAACFPAKRKYYINNYIKTPTTTASSSSETLESIIWTALPTTGNYIKGLAADLKSNYDWNYQLQNPDDYTNAPPTYTGPEWKDAVVEEIPPPNDVAYMNSWLNSDEQQSTTTTTTGVSPKIHYINQRKVRDGMIWAVESTPFLKENMPFWVNIRKMKPPTSAKHPSFIIISIGEENETDYYDLYIGDNSKPFLVDYNDNGVGKWGFKMFDVDLARVLTNEQNVEIGFMTIGGRLVVCVNKVNMIFTRVTKGGGDDSGKFREAKIAAGKVKIYATNIQATINVCPMTFAYMSVMAIPLPSVIPSNSTGEPMEITYKGVKKDGTYVGSVAEVPSEWTQSLYGVDCKRFTGPGGTVNPSGLGFHQLGQITFKRGGNVTAQAIPNSSYYFLKMFPEDLYGIPLAGVPYYFRLKGGFVEPGAPTGGEEDVYDVLSISQNDEAPDYVHMKRNASVVLYNKGGRYDYLQRKQYGIEIYMGWNGDLQKTFTGVIASTHTEETPGKETITLTCEDYMYILKNTQIINSPYYDGMLKFYAVKDLVERAGITDIVNDWEYVSDTEYALPSGYAFTKPAVRFEPTQSLFDCACDILKRDQSFFYFDEGATLHVENVPGGLWSTEGDPTPSAAFTRDPDADDVSTIVLDNYGIDWDYNSMVNRISVITVERDTRAIIFVNTDAPVDILAYRKVSVNKKPALGTIESARVWGERLGQRVFFPIKKVSFRTTGDILADCLDFITVDGLEFRVMAVSRKYNADSNDLNNEYNCEWKGGQ